jgi:predicted esterase
VLLTACGSARQSKSDEPPKPDRPTVDRVIVSPSAETSDDSHAGATAAAGAKRGRRRAVELSRAYLECVDDVRRQRLAEALVEYDDDIDGVVGQLRQQEFEPVKAGYHAEQHFSLAPRAGKHAEDLLYFYVPEGYRPERPSGLIIVMHGGGRTSERELPGYFMSFPGEGESNTQFGDTLNDLGMVVVGPSAPWDEDSAYRWCLVRPSEQDDYLSDVILECKARFNIDPDRVFLVGHSMGGFGAYHQIQRQPDRFAAVIANAGAWYLAHWPVIRGTPLCILHGVRDADRGTHYTDIEYARLTDELLTRYRLDHLYIERDRGHRLYRDEIRDYLKSVGDVRRDPYSSRVTLASPVGFKDSKWYLASVKHNRWVTLEKQTDGNLEYDRTDEWDGEEFVLNHRTIKRRGASIDAEIHAGNVISVTTSNVARFSIWLHSRMVDVNNR